MRASVELLLYWLSFSFLFNLQALLDLLFLSFIFFEEILCLEKTWNEGENQLLFPQSLFLLQLVLH